MVHEGGGGQSCIKKRPSWRTLMRASQSWTSSCSQLHSSLLSLRNYLKWNQSCFKCKWRGVALRFPKLLKNKCLLGHLNMLVSVQIAFWEWSVRVQDIKVKKNICYTVTWPHLMCLAANKTKSLSFKATLSSFKILDALRTSPFQTSMCWGLHPCLGHPTTATRSSQVDSIRPRGCSCDWHHYDHHHPHYLMPCQREAVPAIPFEDTC